MDLKLALKVSDKDNVATIFADGIVDGTEVEIRDKRGDSEKVHVIGDVPFGHKIAVRDIHKGELIMKYEEELNIEDPVLHLLAFPMDSAIDDPVLMEAAKKISETKVVDIMSKDVLTVTPDTMVIDVLRLMLSRDVNRIPVLEKGVLVGIVSRSDIIFSIYKRKI